MQQKSYNNEPTLFLVPTPIGNLEDITIRALNVLKKVKVIFAEDTRETKKLLINYNIKKKLISAYDYNEKIVKYKMVNYLREGYSIALVSDRGAPLICDPGYECVLYVIKNGYNVVSLPAGTAFVPALLMSGIEPYPFVFWGFLSHSKTKKRKELTAIANLNFTIIFYESPHRLSDTLNEVYNIMGNRYISIAREISKKYEEIYRGKIKEIINELEIIKGEIVIIIEGNKNSIKCFDLSPIEQINVYIKKGILVNKAIKMVAKERNLNKNELYKQYHIRK
jgi:16S rRNA (cytidine1402-2'-O)-methyltransferase